MWHTSQSWLGQWHHRSLGNSLDFAGPSALVQDAVHPDDLDRSLLEEFGIALFRLLLVSGHHVRRGLAFLVGHCTS